MYFVDMLLWVYLFYKGKDVDDLDFGRIGFWELLENIFVGWFEDKKDVLVLVYFYFSMSDELII